MVMDTLPLEVLLQIATHLPVRDLASSCAVSVWWREVFGSDEVWKPHCDNAMAEHLEKTPCRVEPKFSTPESDDSTLSPIGRWRLAYMRETHLWRNWIHGNFQEENTSLGTISCILFLNSNIFILLNRNIVKLMDISKSPIECVAELEVFDSCARHKYLTATLVREDLLIVVNCENIVGVIDVDLEKLTLSLRPYFNCLPHVTPCQRFQSMLTVQHYIVNTLLLCLFDSQIFIWDINNCIKLKTEQTHVHKPIVTQSKNCDDIVISGHANDGFYHYLAYNTKELTFWPFSLCLKENLMCAIIKNYIAVISDESLRVYNYKNSQLVWESLFAMTNTCMLRVFRNSFVYLLNGELQQFVPSTGSSERIVDSNDIKAYALIGRELAIVWTTASQKQIWKFGRLSRIKTSMVYKDPFEVNPTFSAILKRTLQTLTLCHFW